MANGRQRRVAARKRGLLQDTDMMGNPILDQNFAAMNTNDGADQRSRLLNTQAGFSPSDLTNLVSNDDNDLDEVSFTTKDGAQVQMKNKRGKTEDGQEVTPTTKMLANRDEELEYEAMNSPRHWSKTLPGGISPDSIPFIGGRGTIYEGNLDHLNEQPTKQASAVTSFIGEDLTQEDTNFAGQGVSTDDFGNVYDQQLNADMLSEQMNRNAFGNDETLGGTEVLESTSYNQNMMPDSIGTSYSGGATQANLQNGSKALTNREKFNQQKINERKNAEAITLFNDLKDKGFNPQEPVLSTDVSQGFEETTHQGTNSAIRQNLLKAEGRVNDAKAGVAAGLLTEDAVIAAEENLATANAAFNKPSDSTDQFGNIVDDYDEQLMREELEAEGMNEEDFREVIDLSQPEVINSEDLTKNTLDPEVEAEEATNEIMAATAGNPETTALAHYAKKRIEDLKKAVETGAIIVDDAKDTITSSLGELGDLLGIEGKDLTRALFRYAGSRIFGSSYNGAAKFAYDGWVTDNSGTALGKNATAKQRNLAAYKAEVAAIDSQVQAGTIDAAEGARQKGFARGALGLAGEAVAPKYFEASFKHSKSGQIYTKRVGPDGVQFVSADGGVLPASETPHLRETAKERELSAATEKALTASQGNYAEAREMQQKTSALLTGFNEFGGDMFSGFLGETSEGIKGFFGQEDELTHLRKGWRELTVMQGINSLPPGVASDKDIELAFSSVPKENANPEFVKAWLTSKQAAANYNAEYSQFEMQFLEENRGRRSGLDDAWKATPEFAGLHANIIDPLKHWSGDRAKQDAVANLPSSLTGKVQQQPTTQTTTTEGSDLVGKYL